MKCFFFLSVPENSALEACVFVLWNCQYLQGRLFSARIYLQKLEERVRGNMVMFTAGTASHLSSKGKFLCVFCDDHHPPLKPTKDRCHEGGSPLLSRLSWALLLVNGHLAMNTRQQWTKPRSMLNLGFPGTLFLEELEVRIKLN